jgi:hypothetical protein
LTIKQRASYRDFSSLSESAILKTSAASARLKINMGPHGEKYVRVYLILIELLYSIFELLIMYLGPGNKE